MYTLNIDISAADLSTIHSAKEQVVITKQTGDGNGNVAWVTFKPLTNNTVTWTDTYELYASTSQVENGATISMMSQVSALDTQQIVFDTVFGSPTVGLALPQGSYGVLNADEDNPSMVFGLAQQANVSGTGFPASPINASIVPKNQSASFSPLDIVQVFLATKTNNGMVITNISSTALTVTLGNGVTTATILYNASTGAFQQSSSVALA